MLTYFPTPYEDELLYSLIARYGVHTGLYENQKAVIRDIFSTSSASAIPDLPSHLHDMSSNLTPVWKISSIDLIRRFTLAPIYLPYLDNVKAKKIVTSMKSNNGGDIHTRVGISASKVKQKLYFQHCPHCYQEQIEKNGEAYWRRSHQLPGLLFCKKHCTHLLNSKVNYHAKSKHRFSSASSLHLLSGPKLIKLNESEKILHDRYVELVNAGCLKGYGHHRWTMFYRTIATEMGLIKNSRVKHDEILELAKINWSGTMYEDHLDLNNENSWLTSIFRKHRKSFHPLRHMLAITSLRPELTIKEVFGIAELFPEKQVKNVHFSGLSPLTDEVKEKRREWIELLKLNPKKGVKEIRKSNPGSALYSWLYRKDRDWLMENKPDFNRRNLCGGRTDYESWDNQNIRYLSNVIDKLRSTGARSRITKTLLIKSIPRSASVEKHIEFLPKTLEWLERNSESVEDYQLVRLKSAYKELINSNTEVKRWRLIRGANIRKELLTPRIELELNKLKNRREV